MPKADKRLTYPWGRASPGMRLSATSERAKKALAQADTPGLAEMQGRWTESVRAAKPLVMALDHLSGAGFRGARGEQRVPGAEVAKATRVATEALGALLASSVVNVSERYQVFASAVEALIALAGEAGRRGVEGGREVRSDDPWSGFKD